MEISESVKRYAEKVDVMLAPSGRSRAGTIAWRTAKGRGRAIPGGLLGGAGDRIQRCGACFINEGAPQ